jgi:hypothetical protein
MAATDHCRLSGTQRPKYDPCKTCGYRHPPH